MRNLFRIISLSVLAAAGSAMAGCGGGGSEVQAGAGVITITAFAPLAIPGGVPTPFTITGTNFETATGVTAQVIFHALGGATPFFGGTSDTATVIGDVTSDTTITGLTPSATVCGVAAISFEVTVILESGVKSNTFTTAGLVFTAPTVTSVTPSSIPAEIPTLITINGTGFGPVGGSAIVRFISDGGFVLFGDASQTETDVQGLITSATAITVTAPLAAVCGAASRTASIAVTLSANGSCSVPGAGVLTYVAPTLASINNPSVPCLTPGTFVITGTGFGPVGAVIELTFTETSVGGLSPIFVNGAQTTTTVTGTIASATTISGTFPAATICTIAAASRTATIRAAFNAGSCADSPAAFVTYRRPTLTAISTGFPGNALRQTLRSDFTLIGTDLDSPATAVDVALAHFTGGGTIYQVDAVGIGRANFDNVPASVTNSTTAAGVSPVTEATAAVPVGTLIQLHYPDGTCTNLLPVTWNPPPLITSFVNTRPPFQQGTPTTFNTDRCLACLSTPVQVNGANFVTGATIAFFDTATGPTLPIGTGLLSTPVVAAAQITGGSPIDTTLPEGVTQVTVRVTNPDGQVGTNTTPRWSTDDVLANVNASNVAGNNAEMMMAVNPTNNRNAVLCSHDLRTLSGQFSPQVFTARTTDGGATWTGQTVGTAATATIGDGFPLGFRGDPMCASDAFGNFYIGYLMFDAPNSGGAGLQIHRIVVVRSADGGVTWTAPTVLQQISVANGANGLDRCGIACGPCRGGGATDQAVYVCWHDFAAAAINEIQVGGYRSTGLGLPAAPAAFAPVSCQSAAPTPGNDFHHPAVAVGPHGELYVAWIERNSNIASTNDWINRDIDGLGSPTFAFGVQNVVTTVVRPNTRVIGWPAPQVNRGYASEPWLTVIPTGPFAGRIVFAYDDKFIDDGVPGDQVNFGLRVLTRVSDNLGVSFSSAIQTHVLDVRHQFQPNLGVDTVTGSVHCTWYDSSADTANNRAVIHFSAVSADGVTWVNPMRLMQATSDVASGSDGNDYLEYCGVAASGGCVYACWCDFTPGNGDVFASLFQQHP